MSRSTRRDRERDFRSADIYCREWGVDGIRLPGVDSKKAKME